MKIINRDHSQIVQNTLGIIVKFKVWQILVILSIITLSLNSNEIDANAECPKGQGEWIDGKCYPTQGATILVEKEYVPYCEPGLVISPTTGQCVVPCGEGTEEMDGICIEPAPGFLQEEFESLNVSIEVAIAIGVIIGIIATVFGIFWTIHTAKLEAKKEDLEMIQKYGEELTNIINSEGDLATKFDCELYAEQYLNTLEQIATLYHKDMLREDVADFFENYFRYGINVWKWYKKNVENLPDFEVEAQMTEGLTNTKELKKKGIESKVQSDRWFYFRWYCNGGDRSV